MQVSPPPRGRGALSPSRTERVGCGTHAVCRKGLKSIPTRSGSVPRGASTAQEGRPAVSEAFRGGEHPPANAHGKSRG